MTGSTSRELMASASEDSELEKVEKRCCELVKYPIMVCFSSIYFSQLTLVLFRSYF